MNDITYTPTFLNTAMYRPVIWIGKKLENIDGFIGAATRELADNAVRFQNNPNHPSANPDTTVRLGPHWKKTAIVATVRITNEAFDELSADLLQDRDFIHEVNNSAPVLMSPTITDEATIEVTAPNRPVMYIDSQGYSYPRYVGFRPDQLAELIDGCAIEDVALVAAAEATQNLSGTIRERLTQNLSGTIHDELAASAADEGEHSARAMADQQWSENQAIETAAEESSTADRLIVVTWPDYTRQALPYSIETLDYLIKQADGYEMIEEVELVNPKEIGQ